LVGFILVVRYDCSSILTSEVYLRDFIQLFILCLVDICIVFIFDRHEEYFSKHVYTSCDT
jgi:hypothetical protein